MADKIKLLQKVAFAVHGFQGIMVFILWIIILVLKAQKGGSPSQANVLFVMCFFSVPVIIYVAMSPRWPRTVKYSHPIAQTVLCGISTIIYFAGFIALAVYNNDGINKGAKNGNKTCSTTANGTPAACNISMGVIGVAVVVFFAFAITTGIYAYTTYYLWKSNLPFTSHLRPEAFAVHDVEATTQDAFSHKDDHMLDPEYDEHGTVPGAGGPSSSSAPGGVYAPLSGTAVGAGRWQGEDDDDFDDYRRDSRDGRHDTAHQSGSVSEQGGRATPASSTYSDSQPQQIVEFPPGPYYGGHQY